VKYAACLEFEAETDLFERDGKGVRVRPIRNRRTFSKYRGIGNPEIPSGGKNIGKWLRGVRGE
jgi:hypothetical protein